MKQTLVNGRWTINLPEHRADRAEWSLENGGWEVERLARMHDVIESMAHDGPPLIFDIGAEEGDFAGLFAMWGARVFAAESNPKVWPNIKAIFEGNDLMESFEGFFNGLVGDTSNNLESDGFKTANIGLPWPDYAYGPVIGNHGFKSLVESRNHLPVTTIDNIVFNHHFGVPSIITMDVEGSELRVLRGAAQLLDKFSPDVFISVHREMMDYDYQDGVEDLLRFMRSRGYTCEWLAHDHESHWHFYTEDGS